MHRLLHDIPRFLILLLEELFNIQPAVEHRIVRRPGIGIPVNALTLLQEGMSFFRVGSQCPRKQPHMPGC